jgi:type IV secretory pathway TraG/TraD family ATPase VirD4
VSWLRKLFGATSGPTRGPVIWGKYTIPQTLAPYHFMACGTTGSGKSALLRMLLRSFLPDVKVKELDTRALIYDPKTELFPDLAALGLEKETLILNPFDSRCTAWDIGRDIGDAAQAKELAAVMVPREQGQNRYFYDASRMLLELAAVSLIKLKKTDWSFRDLLLACSNVDDFKSLTDRAGVASQNAIEDFLTADREAKSVRMTLTVENSAYYTIAAAWDRARQAGRAFSIHDWVDGRGPQVLLVGASKQARTALATVNRLLIQRVQQLLLDYADRDDRSGRRTWVVLDEFPTLGKIPYLEELLTEGRSRGACTVLGFQHIEHVREYYKALGEAMLGQCVHQAYFRANDAVMGKWCASNFGLLIQYDYEHGYKRVIDQQPAATENDFMQLDPATKENGFKCIIRSAKEVIRGPKRIHIPPDKTLEAIGSAGRFVPWGEPLTFDGWTVSERRALGLPDRQSDAPGVGYPENPAQSISDLLPPSATSVWD